MPVLILLSLRLFKARQDLSRMDVVVAWQAQNYVIAFKAGRGRFPFFQQQLNAHCTLKHSRGRFCCKRHSRDLYRMLLNKKAICYGGSLREQLANICS